MRNWINDISVARAGRANRSLVVLSSMMKHAEVLGLQREGSNPCKGLRPRKTGFVAHHLTDDEFAAEYVERGSASSKASTFKATLSYHNSAVPPPLGHVRVASIVRADIARIFREYGCRKPRGADRSHEILRNVFDCTNAWGHRPEATGNRCKGVVRCRRHPRGRLLAPDDPARLGAVLHQRDDENPVCVTAVRLLLLTGFRPDKVRSLRWCTVKPKPLALIDAKTGRRHVPLGEAARELLNGLTETVCEVGIPGRQGKRAVDYGRPLEVPGRGARRGADARLHDLRNAHVPHAVMNGDSLHIAGRLLGHRQATTTNCYVHLSGATLSQAADRLVPAIQGPLQPMPCTAEKVRISGNRSFQSSKDH